MTMPGWIRVVAALSRTVAYGLGWLLAFLFWLVAWVFWLTYALFPE